MSLRTHQRRTSLPPNFFTLTKSLRIAIIFLLLLLATGCQLPEFPSNEPESASGAEESAPASTDSEAVAEDVDKQAGVSAAADAVVEDTNAEVSEAAEAVVVEAPAEEAPATVDWLTVTNRADHELPAMGNPDAALTITEFSDFM